MSTNARIGLKLEDGSILSAYHHWDGYPEWLGRILKQEYNTKEKVAELLDGGNMSSCWSDNVYDYEKQEFVKRDPQPEYYGGDSEAPRLSRNFTQFAFDSKDGEEFLYLFSDNEWNGFSINHKYADDGYILDTSIDPVEIPEDDEVAVA
tara:strand:+ start:158 stop:604 length:447 start_codon:yes stop_codon:yes gene_type:complete